MFTKLTIGDGLVSQVPAFLISLAAGLIVTRSSSEPTSAATWSASSSAAPACSASAAGFLALLAFTALPKVPMLTLAGALGVRGVRAQESRRRADRRASRRTAATASAAPARPTSPPSDRMEDLLQVDPLELEIGYRLIGLADPTRGGDLLDRIRAVRQGVARELG